MLENVNIKTKLLISFGTLLLINVITGGSILYSANNSNNAVLAMEQVRHDEELLLTISNKSVLMHQALALFLNSGDLDQREAYKAYNTDVHELIGEAKQSIHEETLLENLENVDKLLAQHETNIAQPQLKNMLSPYTVDVARLYETSPENIALWRSIDTEFENVLEKVKAISAEKAAVLKSSMDFTMMTTIAGVLFMVATVIFALSFVVRTVSNPLRTLVNVTNKLIDKVWDVSIVGAERKDEIGQLASALETFRDSGIENEKLQAEQAKNDQIIIERAKHIEKIVDIFKGESSQVTEALELATNNMKQTAIEMSGIADNTNRLSQEVASTAQSAGANVENVAAASEELTASIAEISQQLNNTNKLAFDAKDITKNTVEKMRILESSANQIGNVIQLITDIAEQTNLLALNATIESARAGDAGKGFAVVANEVKHLAGETASATEQVKEQVDRIQADTKDAVDFINKIAVSIEQLNEGMTSIAAAMEEQTQATQEISRNVAEASNGTNVVVKNIDDVSAATMQTQKSSEGVSQVADDLAVRSKALKDSISVFINDIQKA
ncbi:MAG: HAMP domain-containing methyl-accepting chemotaxis protein [Pseudomonadota bacterium]|nr:methyl-accepting chemotaxis protein [Alphaproteobacteria bacterium]MEE3323687.1 HAMP domain-containing methyl-accepting chemotaxis protein [Pseudomonadota bacterium]